MSRFEIARAPATIAFAEFSERFLVPERPVILEGVPIDPAVAARVTDPNILNEIEAREANEQRRAADRRTDMWLDVTPDGVCHEPILEPLYEELKRLVPKAGVLLRPTPVRIWASPQGMITSWHYDGNGLHGLNLQVVGRKHWQLVSPNTPMPAYPFMFFLTQGAMPLNDRQRAELEWTEFETQPGDLLFLPRLWAHHVISLERWNLNLNLVYTPTSRPRSLVGEREHGRIATLTALRRSFLWKHMPAAVHESVTDADNYGGDSNYFAGRVSTKELVRSILRELETMPIAGFMLRYRSYFGLG